MLREAKLETINTERKPITIEVDGVEYKTEDHVLTGTEIKALAHRPPGNRLFRLEGHQRIEVQNDESVHLHEHEKFVTQPPVGKAS
ncbi:MAG: multiubiquitin domain-containing protein [Vulcanimicrobiaceae bacterium]